jgi:hypothetical protein
LKPTRGKLTPRQQALNKEAQKRYRQRKREHNESLQRQVAELQEKIRVMEQQLQSRLPSSALPAPALSSNPPGTAPSPLPASSSEAMCHFPTCKTGCDGDHDVEHNLRIMFKDLLDGMQAIWGEKGMDALLDKDRDDAAVIDAETMVLRHISALCMTCAMLSAASKVVVQELVPPRNISFGAKKIDKSGSGSYRSSREVDATESLDGPGPTKKHEAGGGETDGHVTAGEEGAVSREWRAIVHALRLRANQVEQMVTVRATHRAKIHAIYRSRVTIHAEMATEVSQGIQRQMTEDMENEPMYWAMMTAATTEKLRQNLHQEQIELASLNCTVIKNILSPLQAGKLLLLTYPRHCENARLVDVVARLEEEAHTQQIAQ